jgi:hypothetical protein
MAIYTDKNSYLAAPKRDYLSLTARNLLKHKLLTEQDTHLDYGCGYGKDVEILKAKGYQSIGYDPYYFPDCPTEKADVVTCAYVLNVLTQRSDRILVLKQCWDKTRKRLIVSAEAGKKVTHLFSLAELRATIEIALERRASRLDKGIFLVERTAPKIETFTLEEVINECSRLTAEGWVAPLGAVIRGYCTGFDILPGVSNYPNFGLWPARRYFRLVHKKPILPGKSGSLVCHVHLGKTKDTERYQWAVEGIRRRNQILRMKFYCRDFSFIDEFSDCKNWDFLDPNWQPNPDPLEQPDQRRKDSRLANPVFIKVQRD